MVNALKAKGGVHIVVGTVGVLTALIKRNQLRLDQTKYFILDEADQLIDQGGKSTIMSIYNKMTKVNVANATRTGVLFLVCVCVCVFVSVFH